MTRPCTRCGSDAGHDRDLCDDCRGEVRGFAAAVLHAAPHAGKLKADPGVLVLLCLMAAVSAALVLGWWWAGRRRR